MFKTRWPSWAACVIGLLSGAGSAAAAVTIYTSESQFMSTFGTPVAADFEALASGPQSTFAEGGITFASHPPLDNLFIIDPSVVNTNPVPTSHCLTGNGVDDIDIMLPGHTHVVGFNDITNQFAAPVVTLFAGDESILASYTLTQAPNTYGFVGFTSDVVIAKVRWLATGGDSENTAIDNVRYATDLATSVLTWGALKVVYR